MTIKGGQSAVYDGQQEQPDLIVRGRSEDLSNIFWGDANPASNYMQGAIKVQGSQENVMRLDAMAMMIYLGVQITRSVPTALHNGSRTRHRFSRVRWLP